MKSSPSDQFGGGSNAGTTPTLASPPNAVCLVSPHDLLAAVRQIVAELQPQLERAMERVLERRQDDALKPLHVILGLAGKDPAAAARARLRRDPELARLGTVISSHTVKSGPNAGTVTARLAFKPSVVEAYLAAKGGRDDVGR